MPSTDERTIEHLIIDGERVEAADGRVMEILDPSTGELLAHVAQGAAADIDRAVASARRALESPQWAGLTPAQRGRLLFRIADKLRAEAEDLARLESRDNGKPLR